MFARLAIGAVCTAMLTVCVESRADTPIEGNADLVQLILAAQKTNSSQYSHGTLAADVVVRTRQTVSSHVDVMWSNGASYWKYASTEKKNGGGQHAVRRGETIQNGNEWIFFNPDSRLLQSTQTELFAVWPELKIRPADLWFQIDGRVRCVDLLDPAFKPHLLTKYVIREDPAGVIVVERHYKLGGYYTFRVSLAHGGNVISYDTIQKKGEGVWMRGRYDWRKGESGEWYVKELEMERSYQGTPTSVDYALNVKYSQFSLVPEIPAGRFSARSLSVPSDVRKEEFGLDGKLISFPRPKSAPKVTQDDFDRLVEALRRGRFLSE